MNQVAVFTSNAVLSVGFQKVLVGPETEVVGTAKIEDLENGEYDYAFFDMATLGSLATLNRVKETKTQIIVYGDVEPQLGFQCMSLGVRGIISPTVACPTLLKMFKLVVEGQLVYDKKLTDCILTHRKVTITHRESQLIVLISKGYSNKDVANELHISEGTVKVYLSKLFQKLEIQDRHQLALWGLKNLVVDPMQIKDVPTDVSVRTFMVEKSGWN